MKTVHVLHESNTPCEVVEGLPVHWPPDHAWLSLADWPRDDDLDKLREHNAELCPECDAAVKRSRASVALGEARAAVAKAKR